MLGVATPQFEMVDSLRRKGLKHQLAARNLPTKGLGKKQLLDAVRTVAVDELVEEARQWQREEAAHRLSLPALSPKSQKKRQPKKPGFTSQHIDMVPTSVFQRIANKPQLNSLHASSVVTLLDAPLDSCARAIAGAAAAGRGRGRGLAGRSLSPHAQRRDGGGFRRGAGSPTHLPGMGADRKSPQQAVERSPVLSGADKKKLRERSQMTRPGARRQRGDSAATARRQRGDSAGIGIGVGGGMGGGASRAHRASPGSDSQQRCLG